MSEYEIPARLIFTWITKERPIGRPSTSIKHSILNEIYRIILSVDRNSTFNSRVRAALDKLPWFMLVAV